VKISEGNEIAVRFPFWFCVPHWPSYLRGLEL